MYVPEFKFQIGDLVVHKAFIITGEAVGMVIQRYVLEDESGQSTLYIISLPEGERSCKEFELDLFTSDKYKVAKVKLND